VTDFCIAVENPIGLSAATHIYRSILSLDLGEKIQSARVVRMYDKCNVNKQTNNGSSESEKEYDQNHIQYRM
jgi:hypothetical protein